MHIAGGVCDRSATAPFSYICNIYEADLGKFL